MDDKNDLQQRLDAVSIPELRARIDHVVGFLREIRRSIAVHAGMTLEQVPGPIPPMNHINMEKAFNEVVELLPVLRAPLSPAEKKKLRRRSAKQTKAADAALEEMARMDPKLLEENMREAGIDVSHEQIVLLHEGAKKMEMLGEVEQEIRAISAELLAYREKVTERRDALIDAAMLAKLTKGIKS